MVINFLKTLTGGYLGWNIGANDAANVIGPHVGSGLLSYRFCITILVIFTFLGGVWGGQQMVDDVGAVLPAEGAFEEAAEWDLVNIAVLVTLAAGIAVNIATYLGIPTSTSQGSIGAFFGLSIAMGLRSAGWDGFLELPQWEIFGRMVSSWIIIPFLAGFLGFCIQKWGSRFFNHLVRNEKIFDMSIILLLVGSGIYGAYQLGATHAGIAVAPFYRAGIFQSWWGIDARAWAAGFGGLAIALGGLTYAKNVIYSVGTKITALDPFSAFSAVVAMSITLNFFGRMGVPVSTSQAVVGAVAGVGITRGTRAVSFSKVRDIAIGWVATPVFPALISGIIYSIVVHIF